ncbi:hypothetical protein LVY72_15625 [Arthrobacter sp. I2-34]|uniref:Sap, sulfolipid-1-addressing protein n=1 Tax=Arthrobacter hankyongi TaxID=2904801 RepID=A0ABS9L9G9_9MICC|nr:hypothetical protein [Arthrobacter hankyongi]MCG2623327.1 hypothetical protein [Arthrobacter hankyongi]
MTALQYLSVVVLTALGGFDPAPALIAAAALAAGFRRRHVLGFAALLIGGTAAWGLVLTVIGGARLGRVDWHALARGGAVAAWVELALGLGGWALYRALRRRRPESSREVRSPWGLYATAAGFVAIVVFDLPFDVMVVASAGQPPVLAVPGWVAWAALSQAPLTLLGVAVAAGRHRSAVARLNRIWSRFAPVAGTVATACLAVAALVLLADAAQFLVRGHFLVP